MQELIGKAVKYHVPAVGKKPAATYDALVIGFETPAEDKAPVLRLAFIDPARVGYLSGAEFRHAFDQAWGIPHMSDEVAQATGKGWELALEQEMLDARDQTIKALHQELSETTEGRDKALQALADENARKFEPPMPSAADLDAVAEEEKAKEATGKVKRMPKPAETVKPQ